MKKTLFNLVTALVILQGILIAGFGRKTASIPHHVERIIAYCAKSIKFMPVKMLLIIGFLITLNSGYLAAQPPKTYNADSLLSLYHYQKSFLCKDCYFFTCPYYSSIFDEGLHQPVCTFQLYTRAKKAMQEALTKAGFARQGVFAEWHHLPDLPSVDAVYKEANKEIGKPNTVYEMVYGHNNAWIYLAYTPEGAIFSNIPDINAAMEFQGQNIGTMIATEKFGIQLVDKVDSLHQWTGTAGSQGSYKAGSVTVNVPKYFWKLIIAGDQVYAWWMPNLVTETEAVLPQRKVPLDSADPKNPGLIQLLGFDPRRVLN